MKITNRLGLPEAIVKAVENQQYDPGHADVTISTLIRPPQINYLMQKHAASLSEDASERIWVLLGSSIHDILERSLTGTERGEERLYMHISTGESGAVVGGKFDNLRVEDGILTDYKVTSSWSFMGLDGNEVKPEWERQLNYYARLAYDNDITVNGLQIIGILRDWSQSNAMRNPDYPQQPVVVQPVRMWLPEVTREELIDAVMEYEQGVMGNFRPCTDAERWHKPGKVALMKEGRKSAVKLFDTGKDAIEYIKQSNIELVPERRKKGDHYLEERPGQYRRCEDYCAVSDYCEQWKESQV